MNLKTFSYSLAVNLANAIFPLVTLPIVFRALSSNDYGEYVLINVIYQLIFAVFCTIPIQHFIRECTKFTIDHELYKKESIRYILGEFIYVQLYISCVALIFYTVLILVFHYISNARLDLALWFYIPIIISTFNVDWWFFATQNYKILFVRTCIVRLILLVLIFIFVKSSNDVELYSAIMALSYGLSSILGYLYAMKSISYKKPDIKKVFMHLKAIKYFFYNSLIGAGYQYLDQLIIGFLLSRSELAALNILKQLMMMMMMVPNTVCRFLMPNIIQAYNNSTDYIFHKKYNKYYAVLISVSSIITLILGKPFLTIFAGDKYLFTFSSVLLITLAFISTAIAIYIDTQYSIPQKLERITTKSNFVVLSVFLSLLYFFIDSFRYNGVLLSIVLSESIGVILMIFYHLKYKRIM